MGKIKILVLAAIKASIFAGCAKPRGDSDVVAMTESDLGSSSHMTFYEDRNFVSQYPVEVAHNLTVSGDRTRGELFWSFPTADGDPILYGYTTHGFSGVKPGIEIFTDFRGNAIVALQIFKDGLPPGRWDVVVKPVVSAKGTPEDPSGTSFGIACLGRKNFSWDQVANFSGPVTNSEKSGRWTLVRLSAARDDADSIGCKNLAAVVKFRSWSHVTFHQFDVTFVRH